MQVDSIKIECEEDGFHLIVVTDAAHHDINIQNCAEALHEQVNLIIGGWLREGQRAASEAAWNYETGAYDISDPKHPDFHSVHADIWDNREKV